MSRVEALLSGVNQAIVRQRNRKELLDEICRLAVERGGFKLAWIGMVERDGSIRSVAASGEAEYVVGIRVVTSADDPAGQGPVGTAIREQRPMIVEDIESDPCMVPWRERALQFGLRYVAAFPLPIGDRVAGAFQAYAPRAGFFDEAEVRLLMQVSEELSFALTALEHQAELTLALERHNKELRESEQRLRAIVDTAVEGIVTINQKGIIESMNPAACRMFGYAPDEIMGKNVSQVIAHPWRDRHNALLAEFVRTGKGKVIGPGVEVLAVRKGGTVFPVDLTVTEIVLDGQRRFTGFVRDITERKRLEREVLEASDDEMRRLGRDLHDGVGQQLTALALLSSSLESDLSSQAPALGPACKQIGIGLRQLIRQVRLLSHGFTLVPWEGEGLSSALRGLAESTRAAAGVECEFQDLTSVTLQDPQVATHLFRIAQEAVNNALKHSHARHIRLTLTSAPGRVELEVSDNGTGFVPDHPAGLGLRAMRYRADLMGAVLRIDSTSGHGARIVCSLTRPA